MSKSHFEINPDALKELMLSPEMEQALFSYAGGYKGDKRAWRSHDRVAIQIYRDNNDDNKMLKDLFGGKTDAD